ncbi:MAG: hypothetical protein Q7T71_00620 [Herbiconiux sp.]|nr:hypothetical protein [Herbiconiux sp.]
MSTIGEPGQAPGRLPKQVYWRRRAVVLLALIAVIVVVVLIVVRPGSAGAGAGTGGEAVAPPATGTTAPDAAGTGGDAGTGAGAGSSTAPAALDTTSDTPAGEVAACAAGNISLVPVTDASNYAAGVNPQLSFTITNTGADPCSINAGTSQQVYTITSGSETYWTSTDCQTDPSDTPAVLEPGVAVSSTPFGWDRTRSAADTCASPDRPAVPAAGASYHLAVSVAGIPSSDTQQFILN